MAIDKQMRDRLLRYMELRQQATELEARESECSCGDFKTCDPCDKSWKVASEMSSILRMWGDDFLVEIAEREGLTVEAEA